MDAAIQINNIQLSFISAITLREALKLPRSQQDTTPLLNSTATLNDDAVFGYDDSMPTPNLSSSLTQGSRSRYLFVRLARG